MSTITTYITRYKKHWPVLVVVGVGLLLAILILATGKNDTHDEHAAEIPRGPHGGKLFEKDGIAVEVTIYESGVPPEFRLYVYDQEKAVDLSHVSATIELDRVARPLEIINFSKREDYLLGDKVIVEPHSFDAKIKLSFKGKTNEWVYSQREGRTKLAAATAQQAGITLEVADSTMIKSIIELPGEITSNANKVAHIVPRLTGVIMQVSKNVGDHVSAGEVIAVIESRDLADLKSEYLTNMRKQEHTKQSFEREEALWNKKIASEQDYMTSKQNYQEAQIQMDNTVQKLLAMGISRGEIERLASGADKMLARYEIRAPFAATIINRNATSGEFVRGDETIFIVSDLSEVWVDITVYADDIAKVRAGQSVTVRSEAVGLSEEGKVSYVEPIIGTESRAAKARVVLANKSGMWRPGMFAKVALVQEQVMVPVAVKLTALQSFRDWTVVFLNEGDEYEVQPVELGRRDNEYVEVVSGLTPGTRYVATNSYLLKADVEKSGATHDH
jgi:membrane fusion protein, heavy metal efflux system